METQTSLKPHQERVIQEHEQLKERTSKLSAFILDNPTFLTLDEVEQRELKIQYEAMCTYQDVLERRIKRF